MDRTGLGLGPTNVELGSANFAVASAKLLPIGASMRPLCTLLWSKLMQMMLEEEGDIKEMHAQLKLKERGHEKSEAKELDRKKKRGTQVTRRRRNEKGCPHEVGV